MNNPTSTYHNINKFKYGRHGTWCPLILFATTHHIQKNLYIENGYRHGSTSTLHEFIILENSLNILSHFQLSVILFHEPQTPTTVNLNPLHTAKKNNPLFCNWFNLWVGLTEVKHFHVFDATIMAMRMVIEKMATKTVTKIASLREALREVVSKTPLYRIVKEGETEVHQLMRKYLLIDDSEFMPSVLCIAAFELVGEEDNLIAIPSF